MLDLDEYTHYDHPLNGDLHEVCALFSFYVVSFLVLTPLHTEPGGAG